MANFTPNINLKKPIKTEKFTIDDVNGNSDLIDAAIANKQPTLVSSTNIKTINGLSILGSGNVEVSANYPEVFILPNQKMYDVSEFVNSNGTVALESQKLVASNVTIDFPAMFVNPNRTSMSFTRVVPETWVVLGGTTTRFTALRILNGNIDYLIEFIDSGANNIMIDNSVKWSGTITDNNDLITISFLNDKYEVSVRGTVVYTITLSAITNPDAQGFKVNQNMGIVLQKTRVSASGLVTFVPDWRFVAPLEGKFVNQRWNVLGDSITLGTGITTKYFDHVKTALLFSTVTNYGISGTEICTSGTFPTPFISRYASMDATATLISVLGGVNDFLHNAELGTFASRDNATFYGALHNLCAGLQTTFANAKYFFMTPLRTNGSNGNGEVANTKGYKLVQYVNAIKEVCAYYCIPVLDLYTECGFTPDVSASKSVYMPDGLHPSEVGHKRLGDKITSFLTTL